jgi:TRAP-type C4-dicarboxylate transport system substrate-binding protein
MQRMHARTRLAIVVAAAAIVAAGCTANQAGDDKAGGAGTPVVLRMANAYAHLDYTPAIQYFVSRVEELSNNNISIEVAHEWGGTTPDAEQRVVNAVSGGRLDLGWVGTRVFDTMGVNTFQALQAPMLIDSYALEDAVIRSGIPGEMLRGLDDMGVVGLAVLADGLRKPLAVHAPLLGPGDYRGIGFGSFLSEGQAQAIRALGATPAVGWGEGLNKGFQNGEIEGVEKNLLVYKINGMTDVTPYVTANVNLWPQMDVVFVNADRLATLTDQQQTWIRQVAQEAAARSAEFVDQDQEIVADMCELGTRFANASNANIADLQDAFAPLYADLRQDPQTADFIEQIQELKLTTPPEPALAFGAACTGDAQGHAAQ